MMKMSFRAIVALLLLTILWPNGIGYAADNLLKNSSFEQATSGIPENWTQDLWFKEDGITVFSVDQNEFHSGTASVAIENVTENHARWLQTIQVKSNTYYKISAYVKVSGAAEDRTGANLFINGVAASYPSLTDTAGQWNEIHLYGKTGDSQTELTIGASLGGYGSLNTGKAYFDDIAAEEVTAVPEGNTSIDFVAAPATTEAKTTEHPVSIFTMLLFGTFFSLLFVFVYQKLVRDNNWLERRKSLYPVILAVVFMLALAVRVWIAVSIHGYANDIALFQAWANHAATHGLSGFYNTDMFVDYPPGFIYVLYIIGALMKAVELDAASNAALLLFKLPAITADLFIAYFTYQVARKKFSYSVSIGLAILYLFNPAIIVNSSAWGQVDSIYTLLLVLAIQGISEKRIERASVWFGISALVKPQTFIFMPVLLLYFVYRRAWRQIPVSAFYGLTTFGLLSLPFFWGNGGLAALIQLYKNTLSSYPYANLNAYNLYALSNGSFKPLETVWFLFTYETWGNIFIVAAVLLAVYFSLRRSDKSGEDNSFYIATVLMAVVFICVTKMHERYLFPIVLLSLFTFIQTMDRRMLYILAGFSLTAYFNTDYVLKHNMAGIWPTTDGVVLVCSIANISLLLYLLYIGYDIFKRDRLKPVQVRTEEEKQEQDRILLAAVATGADKIEISKSSLLKRKDWIWMGAITLIYAVVALYQLGSLKGPETVWEPSAEGQSFYVDLGESKQIDRIVTFNGVGTGDYTYEYGNSLDQLVQPEGEDKNHVTVFKWNKVSVQAEARYVKLTVGKTGFSMHEMAIYEVGSDTPLPITEIHAGEAAEAKRGSVKQLFDEQTVVPSNPSFMNESYFDEIYHARTAYEHLEGIKAYENTHPPLGKIFIAIGIKLFGLNPFGWRITGTLFGIAMLPLIYIFALRLFKQTSYAAFATALFAVDFMHFAQTRIATIDVYGVFFILFMFYFMHRYYRLNFYNLRFSVTLLPLFLAGLFFGIGVASKWIALYGGVGLALMLGMSLYERYKQYAAAKRALSSKGQPNADSLTEERLASIIRSFPRKTAATLAACILFFVIIPLAVYGLSYIPVLTAMDEGYTIKGLIDYQKNMYNYHSNLIATHPFGSSWWEWPFMKRPVWYYSGDNMAEGQVSSIVSMGNPLIWWLGIFTMLLTLWISIKRKDKAVYVIWIAYFVQYVPWMLVPRLTFLYHYFAMVPFIILSIVYIFKVLEEKSSALRTARYVYLAAAVLLFILFYPALSGMRVPSGYVEHMLRWFPSWLF